MRILANIVVVPHVMKKIISPCAENHHPVIICDHPWDDYLQEKYRGGK